MKLMKHKQRIGHGSHNFWPGTDADSNTETETDRVADRDADTDIDTSGGGAACPADRSRGAFHVATVASDKANIYGLSICEIRRKRGEGQAEGQQQVVSRRNRLVPRRHMLLQTPRGRSRFN